jgi:hypothetical protein
MSSLKHKIYNYEQSPPPGVWDKITASLDDSHLSDEFPSKLYNAEAEPPPGAWDKIANELESEQEPAVRLLVKRFSFFRYAAAAVLIGITAIGVIKWMNQSNTETGGNVAVVDSAKMNRLPDVTSTNPPPSQNSTQSNNSTLNEAGSDAVAESPVRAASVKKAKNSYTNSDNAEETAPIYAYNDVPNLADRYIMYMTPDGGIVRMSKKWGSLVCCVSGQEQDEDCKDQIKKWQEKLACSPVATSNFMDILSLVSTLNTTEL